MFFCDIPKDLYGLPFLYLSDSSEIWYSAIYISITNTYLKESAIDTITTKHEKDKTYRLDSEKSNTIISMYLTKESMRKNVL